MILLAVACMLAVWGGLAAESDHAIGWPMLALGALLYLKWLFATKGEGA